MKPAVAFSGQAPVRSGMRPTEQIAAKAHESELRCGVVPKEVTTLGAACGTVPEKYGDWPPRNYDA
jgi:hypothetical protein